MKSWRTWTRALIGMVAASGVLATQPPPSTADLLIRHALIYDGRGGAPFRGDVAVTGDRVVAVGELGSIPAQQSLDAHGRALAPGFINMLSGAEESLLYDGRGLSDLRQGVTLEVFGEGQSFGPLSSASRAELEKTQTDIHFKVTWTTLGEFLDQLVARGISVNVASFVGAATVRIHELGYANRDPSAGELERMRELVRQGMREGALGVGSALIYAPGAYAHTPELIALAQAAAEFGGGYTSHIRSEGDRLLEALDEHIEIARSAHVHAQVHHLKAAGTRNWPKMKEAIAKIEAARAAGVAVSANMYPYTAGATGLDAAMPPWVQEGGIDAWVERLRRPDIRARVLAEMRAQNGDWENLLQAAGSPDRVLLIGFRTPRLKAYTGKTLAQVARELKESSEEAAIDLVIEDHARIETAYFLMSEDNVRLGLAQPWVSLDSDEGALAPEGAFLLSNPHPRAYGAFARFLGHYVRDEKVTSLEDAIRRMTRAPAESFKIRDRGCLDPGCHADLVLFDPATIADRASFEHPREFATGVSDVFVNGVQVIRGGAPTGAKPGQVARGPGWIGWREAKAQPRASPGH